MTDDRRRLDPRTALLAAAGLFVLGVAVHLAFAVAGRRPTPITLFAFAPPIAVLASLRVRPDAESRRVAASLLWGVAATAIGFAAVFLTVQWYSYVPEGRSTYQLFRFDLDLYLWFVLSLAGTYTAAARLDAERALAVLAASPVVQASVPVALVLLEQWFVARGGV